MKTSKFYFYTFIFGLLFLNQILLGMGTGHFGKSMSEEYNNFIQEINKSLLNSSNLEELYYKIEDKSEKKSALFFATEKNVIIKNQEAEQEKIRRLIKNAQITRTAILAYYISSTCDII